MAFNPQNIINAFIRLLEERPALFSGHYEALNEHFNKLPRDERHISEGITEWCAKHSEIADAHLEILLASGSSNMPIQRGGPGGAVRGSCGDQKEEPPRDPISHLFNIFKRASPQKCDSETKSGRPKE